MIRALNYINVQVIPQAIFFRPLRYFSTNILIGEDDLDSFNAAAFCIGNLFTFDVRTYRGDPPCIVTLYMESELASITIADAITRVRKELRLPAIGVVWRRGESFEYGKLDRPEKDRLTEKEARILCLKIAGTCQNYEASTDYIKREIPKFYTLSPIDMIQSKTRPNEEKWQQIVGNVISHRDTLQGPFKRGYAVRTSKGMRLTPQGRTYLNNMGFSV